MYERMLDQQVVPTVAEMAAHCGEQAELFHQLNRWLTEAYGTAQRVVFPYGKRYGWGIAHRKGKTLICNIFAEAHAFTVMMRLSNQQFESVYHQLQSDTRDYIDRKYPCGNGGWIHYRVTSKQHFEDIRTLLILRCS